MTTSEQTLRGWESGTKPLPSSYPKIIEFLAREPWPEPSSTAEAIRYARLRKGLTIEQAASAVGVEPSTWWWWERGRKPHAIDQKRRLRALMGASRCTPTCGTTEPALADLPDLGTLVRERRRERGLTMEATAREIGVNAWTVLGWEHNRHFPPADLMPAIIRFLGREPWPEPRSLGDRLRAERLRRGLTQAQAAVFMRVSRESVADWEIGRAPCHHATRAKAEAFAAGMARPRRSGR